MQFLLTDGAEVGIKVTQTGSVLTGKGETMPRYIDLYDDRNCYIGNDGEYERYNIDPDVIAEAIDIVRCRDCEFYTAVDRWCRRLGLCGAFGEDDFCCHGERR